MLGGGPSLIPITMADNSQLSASPVPENPYTTSGLHRHLHLHAHTDTHTHTHNFKIKYVGVYICLKNYNLKIVHTPLRAYSQQK